MFCSVHVRLNLSIICLCRELSFFDNKFFRMPKAALKKKAANGYKLAEPLPKGEILEDVSKKTWKLGSAIGQGGFGEIYEAQEAGASGSKYPYVVKIEPHTNGPLFVEMHFYMRNAKPAEIDEFKAEKKLKTFGMPLYLGSGSHEFKSEKYRFVVMEKFGTDLWKLFLENNRIFPPDTVFKLGIQILDVLEYMHRRGYVHADIKGANILMGLAKGATNQAFLVDFGLATKFTTEKEFKPNPKKAHDGTIEYLSRDAHKGVQTRRGDLEILAYNLIQWLGCTLPWENNLSVPNTVHQSKEEHMNDVQKMNKACFGKNTPPGAIVDYLNYLKTLKFNTEPDYKKIRKIFISGIKDAGGSENSPLVFSASKRTPQKRKIDSATTSSPKRKLGKGRKVKKPTESGDEDDVKGEQVPPKRKLRRGRDAITPADGETMNAEEDDTDELSPKRKAGRDRTVINPTDNEVENVGAEIPSKITSRKGRKAISPIDDKETQNMVDNTSVEEVTDGKHSDVDEEDMAKDDIVDDEAKPRRRVGRPKKNNVTKTATSDKANDGVSASLKIKDNPEVGATNGATDPFEGYTDAMKEIMQKKLKKGKSKRAESNKLQDTNSMEGYNQSMKELALKKKERLRQKVVKNKGIESACNENAKSSAGLRRGNRLRDRKVPSYVDQVESDSD
ncbi:hypothetical protein NQ315_009452 [Exocentrus adspersus]|uniref:non-specific serine/threonine protein kinase n=1 Tax=Exocentrus adspersus TaxID=1586481 RepID=A0AAV8WHA6_9CUCU|nr:hypothetical protein NQ315_009452 [Exocentrus adspersus]